MHFKHGQTKKHGFDSIWNATHHDAKKKEFQALKHIINPSLVRYQLRHLVFVLAAACGPRDVPAPSSLPDPEGFTATAISTTTVSLSWQTVPGALGYVLDRKRGDQFVQLASPGPAETGFLDQSLSPDTSYTYRLRASPVAGNPGVERTVRTLGGGTMGDLSTFDLIDKALGSGAIDLETAVQYKVFATFKDPRLPAEYRGGDGEVIESDALDEVYEHWESLSTTVQETLEPFLVPPIYVGSWATAGANPAGVALRSPLSGISVPICRQPTIDPSWAAKPASTDGRVKVWYDTRVAGQAVLASIAQTELETQIWPSLITGLGMRAPISDGAIAGCNGGDGRLDVYLVDIGTYGQNANDLGETFPVTFATREYPTFILINRNLSPDDLKGALAHEFMHASQWAYPVAALGLSSYFWLKESTAQWAIDHVYPGNQLEQRKAEFYMKTPADPLNTEENGKGRIYGSYLFFQFLARTIGASRIKDVWNATTSNAEAITAVDAAIPGGFHEQWPKFAKQLWNQDPVDSFVTWDGMQLTPDILPGDSILNVNLGGKAADTQLLNGNIKHLATHYYHFRFPDPNVRSVLFMNHVFAVTPVPPYHITTQAFVKKQGSIWEYQHWSDEGLKEVGKRFCLDLVAERVEELVIVMSNDSPTEDITFLSGPGQPRLSASNVGCWRYQGTTSIVEHGDLDGVLVDSAVDGTVTLERWRPPEVPDGLLGRETFVVQSGAVTGDSRTVIGCTTTRHGAGPMAVGLGDANVDVGLGLDVGTGEISRAVGGVGTSSVQTTTTLVCDGTTVSTNTGPDGWEWLTFPIDANVVVLADGTISGTFTQQPTEPAFITETVTWKLTPLLQ